MGYGMDQLPKKVASLVKKLAKLQREKNAYIKSSGGYRLDDHDFCDHMDQLGEKGDKLIEDLCCTKFALLDVGILDPEDEDFYADNLRALAEYFLSLYAEERQDAEMKDKKYDEDLFYAASYLINEARIAEELDEMNEEDGEDEPIDEEDYYKILAELEDTFGELIRNEEKKQPEGKVIQMFGEKKGKKK